ncbi:hypothetical protein CONPUDRAFT_156427 [Coniophora puteana RWD-64-598 SS2]|uniref:DUF6699 domain-containing protein n=1 Tax=Coniophora puteana (strain RWD-64-598) TaxID=741705 RepID=A0A5M3MI32_CONPW|nr:uncharacterized protein CONPUDRAFT_156427 [Coniophora puteana RWD-64-598 SS2]EIW78444.1 hypothetical protein CONPUDRAFT_156427 [Coniophora puteana RWD-64-598 SS2]
MTSTWASTRPSHKPTPSKHRAFSSVSSASSWGTLLTDSSTSPTSTCRPCHHRCKSVPNPKHKEPTQIQIHPLISYNPHNLAFPSLQWDIRQDLTSARRITPAGLTVPLALGELNVEATYPRAWNARIVIAPLGAPSSHTLGLLLGPTTPPLTLDKSKSGTAITLKDVLTAVHEYLRVPVKRAQYDHACERVAECMRSAAGANAGKELVSKAFYGRCKESAGIADVERAQGVRRVDCLGDAVVWAGAWAVYMRDEGSKEWTWEMRVAVMPKPR